MVADGALVYEQAFREGLRPEPRLTVSEWAELHRRLSPKASADTGRWHNDRTPYLVEPMDCLSARSPVREVVFMKGAQVGGTEAGNNWVGYVIDHAPCPMMVVLPTLQLAQRSSRQRIDPLIEDTPRLVSKVAPRRAKDGGNSTFTKEFPGGVLILTGANSAVGLRSQPARYVFGDEIDAWPGDVDEEGDPMELVRRRAATFGHRAKLFWVSTPTVEGRSRVARLFEESDQRYYLVSCPECGHAQRIVWDRIRWEKDEDGRDLPDTAALACEGCGVLLPESAKTDMLARGEWVPTFPEREIRGYHLSALYSPAGWFSWADAVRTWVRAQGNVSALRAFVNTVLGETWREKGEAPAWERLFNRREKYAIGRVPSGGRVLTAGVDVQRDRIELELVAWGPRDENWSVDYRVHQCDPASPEPWRLLDALLAETFPHELGGELRIAALGIDSGFASQAVYDWVRRQDPRRVLALKGDDRAQQVLGQPKAVDVTAGGRRAHRGVRVWPVGVGHVKGELYGWLRQEQPTSPDEPLPHGWSHFPEYAEEFFRQLTAEHLVKRTRRNGYLRWEWEKHRDRNEALDCRVYSRAALWSLGAHRWTDEDWEQLRAAVTRAEGAEPKQKQPTPRRRRRGDGGYLDRWRGQKLI